MATEMPFDSIFSGRTLRADYTMTGGSGNVAISLNRQATMPGWAGRRHHLSQLPLQAMRSSP